MGSTHRRITRILLGILALGVAALVSIGLFLKRDTSTLLAASHAIAPAPRGPFWWLNEQSLLVASSIPGRTTATVIDRQTHRATQNLALTGAFTRHSADLLQASISPDGKFMALVDSRGKALAVCVISLETGAETRIPVTLPALPATLRGSPPVSSNVLWSAQGRQLVFFEYRRVRPARAVLPKPQKNSVVNWIFLPYSLQSNVVICSLHPSPRARVFPLKTPPVKSSPQSKFHGENLVSRLDVLSEWDPAAATTGFAKYMGKTVDPGALTDAEEGAAFVKSAEASIGQCQKDLVAAASATNGAGAAALQAIQNIHPQYDMELTPNGDDLPSQHGALTPVAPMLTISPDQSRVAWIKIEPRRSTSMSRLLDLLTPGGPQPVRHYAVLYTATIGKPGRHEIGRIAIEPNDFLGMPKQPRWLPGGKSLSFVYHGSLWTVNTTP